MSDLRLLALVSLPRIGNLDDARLPRTPAGMIDSPVLQPVYVCVHLTITVALLRAQGRARRFA